MFKSRHAAGIAVTALAVAAPLAVSASTTAAHAEAARAPACPTPFPVGEVHDGLTGHGFTVSKGTAPERFTVKVQGVLKDGIAPGIDMILAEADSPALDKAGAIWAGMSGSPVYAQDGRLLGAVGYGFSGASKLAGITPAKAMLDILKRPGQSRAQRLKGRVKLPDALRQKVTSRGLVSARAAAGGLSPLRLPYAVSGLSQHRINAINAALAKKGSSARLHRAGAASGRPAPVGQAVPGGNFGVLQSYGAVTQGAIGTTTVVCDGRALAFGHAYFQGFGGPLPAGPVQLSAVSGEALAIVPDATFGPFKLANFGGIVGTLTQDRFAGVAAKLGAGPPVTPINAKSTANGATRSDTTYVNRHEDVPLTTAYHTLGSIDQARDQISGGRTTVGWTVRGTAAGRPWQLKLGNRYADSLDVTTLAGLDIAGKLTALENNPFSDVRFTDLKLTAGADSKYAKYTVGRLLVKSGGRWVPLNPDTTLKVTGGRTLVVRAELLGFRTPVKTVDVKLNVPRKPRGTTGKLVVGGGLVTPEGTIECDPQGSPEECSDSVRAKAKNFADLLAKLGASQRNDTLIGSLTLGRNGAAAQVSTRLPLDQVADGQIKINVTIG